MDSLQTELDNLAADRLAYVFARIESSSTAAACRTAGISRAAFYTWDNDERAHLEALAEQCKRDRLFMVMRELEAAALEAVRVKVAGLRSRKDHIQQAVATEILDRFIGRPTQRNELTGKDGGPVEVDNDHLTDEQRVVGLMALYERIRARVGAQADNQDCDICAPAGATD